MSDDRSAVERLADEWASIDPSTCTMTAPWSAARDLTAAIEADRAAGWLRTKPEVERLRAERSREILDALMRNREVIKEARHRAEHAEAKLAEVRALADEWTSADDSTFYGNRLRRVLDQEPVDE